MHFCNNYFLDIFPHYMEQLWKAKQSLYFIGDSNCFLFCMCLLVLNWLTCEIVSSILVISCEHNFLVDENPSRGRVTCHTFMQQGDNLFAMSSFSTKSLLLASHAWFRVCLQVKQMSIEMKAISCSCSWMWVGVSVVWRFNFESMTKTGGGKKTQTKQSNSPELPKSSDNPLFCFLNQVLQKSSTALSNHAIPQNSRFEWFQWCTELVLSTLSVAWNI